MIENILNFLTEKSIELFEIIHNFDLEILAMILSIVLINTELDKDLSKLENVQNNNIEEYIQSKIYIKRLEEAKNSELRNLNKIIKNGNIEKKQNNEVEKLKESILYLYKKEKKLEERLKISFLKKTMFALDIFILVIIKIYTNLHPNILKTGIMSIREQIHIIILSILFASSVVVSIYYLYISIKNKKI